MKLWRIEWGRSSCRPRVFGEALRHPGGLVPVHPPPITGKASRRRQTAKMWPSQTVIAMKNVT